MITPVSKDFEMKVTKPFQIAFCSSEDANHPISEIMNYTNSRGWESEKDCIFPQIIILELFRKVKVSQVQFLCHQFKIPSKIEIYANDNILNIPSNAEQILNLSFNYVGFISLNKNEENSFTSRELKSVFVNISCVFMKLIIYECYFNILNKFNQVGIYTLKIIGDSEDIPKLGLTPSALDASLIDQINLLNKEKEKAIQMEDYGEAKRLKQIVDNLLSSSSLMNDLELKKLNAIKLENFEQANMIQKEINILKNAIPNLDEPSNIEINLKNSSNSKDDRKLLYPINSNYTYNLYNIPYSHNMQPLSQNIDPSVVMKNEINHLKSLRSIPPQGVNLILNKILDADKDLNIQINDEIVFEGVSTPEELSQIKKQYALPFLSKIDLSILEMIFSVNWNNREKGLEILQDAIENKNWKWFLIKNEEIIFSTIIGLCGILIEDKVYQVAYKSMNVLNIALKNIPGKFSIDLIYSNQNINNCITNIIKRIADPIQGIKKYAEESLVNLSGHSLVGNETIFKFLISKGDEELTTNSLKERYNVLSLITNIKGIENCGNATISALINFGISGIQNKYIELRASAYSFIIELYKKMGNNIHKFLANLDPSQIEIINSQFEEIDKEKKLHSKSSNNLYLENPRSAVNLNQKLVQENIDENDSSNKICKFCGKYNPEFDVDTLDMHMYSECQMLYLCKNCGNILEILSLPRHLLDECSQKEFYRECPTCKDAIPISEYQSHIINNSCIPLNPLKYLRCPLCSKDLEPPTLASWRNHILNDKCRNNERTSI